MALFENLHHVGDVMVQLISANLETAAPVTVATLTEANPAGEGVRVTLLWVTPQATHRNDPFEISSAGQRVPPPITVSAFYLVTTYGTTSEDPIRAHELLGNVLQAFHTYPALTLPDTGLPGVGGLGEGRLTFVQAPTTAELMEHIYTPLPAKHRPWVLYEVGPVQLAMRMSSSPAGALVRPGGVILSGPDVLSKPIIERLTPQRQAPTGIVRLDVDLKGRPLQGVTLGTEFIPTASLTPIDVGKSYLLTLPSDTPENTTLDLRLRTGELVTPPLFPIQFSERERVATVPETAVTLDAPPKKSLASPTLVLTGRALSDADSLFIWPDTALAQPIEVRTLSPLVTTATSVSVTSTQLAADPAVTPGIYRAAVHFPDGFITSFVVLEVTP